MIRDRIDSTFRPGVAPKQPPDGQGPADEYAVAQNRRAGVCGAGGIKFASCRSKRRDPFLIGPNGQYHDFSEFFQFAHAEKSSFIILARSVLLQVRARLLATMIISQPFGRISRLAQTASRMIRRIRLRSGELPSFLLTVIPSRSLPIRFFLQ